MPFISPIPKIFHQTDGGLLSECIMCKKNILLPAQDYLIEKVIRVYPNSTLSDTRIQKNFIARY